MIPRNEHLKHNRSEQNIHFIKYKSLNGLQQTTQYDTRYKSTIYKIVLMIIHQDDCLENSGYVHCNIVKDTGVPT